MARKKDRAFFVCPRWAEVLQRSDLASSDVAAKGRIAGKTCAAIEQGRPVARSTLRDALLAVRRVSGTVFDVDPYIVDRRRPGGAPGG